MARLTSTTSGVGWAWAVAGWAVFGLLGLVWVVRALQR
jgi:hypothetical protein